MENMSEKIYTSHALEALPEQKPVRADVFIAEQIPHYSRSYLQDLIKQGLVAINNKVAKSSTIVKPLDHVTVSIPPVPSISYKGGPEIEGKLQNFDVKIIYEHKEFLIVAKPAGLMVHKPSAYNTDVTLVDWLLSRWQQLKMVGDQDRPGIVHRLDKDTSGLMVIPRTNYAHFKFSDLFKNRAIKKTYLAIVRGHPDRTGSIDFPIDRDPITRNKMSHQSGQGRAALTHYKVLEYFTDTTLVEVLPVTGRTHQIRVHFNAIGHPLEGDILYGKKSSRIDRQALHATSLSFAFDGEPFSFSESMPADMQVAIDQLKK
ncbi:RluA family pseudouridine synthase [Candidatus Dependentiae bacterium]|nr:RluA family pseudouridine synthase [Candidatus Dependentiae bacterium]